MTINIAYNILGLKPNSNIEEVKKAYKNMVKKYHPDVYNGLDADNITANINNAYETIKNYLKTYKPEEKTEETFTSPYLKYIVPTEAILKLKKTHFQIIDEFLKQEEFYKSFNIQINFNDWLKNELLMQDLLNKLNVDKNSMIFLYNARSLEDRKLNFTNWLYKFYANIIELYTEELNIRQEQLEQEYSKDILHNNIPFIKWLDIKLYKTCRKTYFNKNVLNTFMEFCKSNAPTFKDYLKTPNYTK